MNRYLILIFCLWSSFSAAVKWDEVKGHILKNKVFSKNVRLLNLKNEDAFVSSLLTIFKRQKNYHGEASKYHFDLKQYKKLKVKITQNGVIYLFFNKKLSFNCRVRYGEDPNLIFINKGPSNPSNPCYLKNIAYELEIPFSIADEKQIFDKLEFKKVETKKRPSRNDSNLRARKKQKVSNKIINGYLPQDNTCPSLAYNECLPPVDTFYQNCFSDSLSTNITYQPSLSLNNNIYFHSVDNKYLQQPADFIDFNQNYLLNYPPFSPINNTYLAADNLLPENIVSAPSFFQSINNIDQQYYQQNSIDNLNSHSNDMYMQSYNFNENRNNLSNSPPIIVNCPPQLNIESFHSMNAPEIDNAHLPSFQPVENGYQEDEYYYFDCNDFEIFNEEQNDCLNQQSDNNVSPTTNLELVKWETIKDIIRGHKGYSEVREKFQYDTIEEFVLKILAIFKEEKTTKYKDRKIYQYRGYIPVLENENKVDIIILKSGAVRLVFDEMFFNCITSNRDGELSISFVNKRKPFPTIGVAYKLTVPFSLKGEVKLPTNLSFKRFNFENEEIKKFTLKSTYLIKN